MSDEWWWQVIINWLYDDGKDDGLHDDELLKMMDWMMTMAEDDISKNDGWWFYDVGIDDRLNDDDNDDDGMMTVEIME